MAEKVNCRPLRQGLSACLNLCARGCAKLDPVCKWPEKGLYCGLLQCVEDGRPFILMMGAFMGAAVAAGGGVAKLHAALLCFVN